MSGATPPTPKVSSAILAIVDSAQLALNTAGSDPGAKHRAVSRTADMLRSPRIPGLDERRRACRDFFPSAVDETRYPFAAEQPSERAIRNPTESASASIPSHSRGSIALLYGCKTQKPSKPTKVRVGCNGHISRFPRNTIITYTVNFGSFPFDEDGMYIAACFERAAASWNQGSHQVPLRFQYVPPDEPATFSIVYLPLPDDGDTKAFAEAFFPRDMPEDRELKVFDRALRYRDYMVNILAHEIGHILGLRHEFVEQDHPSVQVGPTNLYSVMNYFDHPGRMVVSQQDINGALWLYNYPWNTYLGLPIVVSPLLPIRRTLGARGRVTGGPQTLRRRQTRRHRQARRRANNNGRQRRKWSQRWPKAHHWRN